jgi:hypothetical protein
MNDYVGGLENNTKLLVMREIKFILEKLMLERETYKRENGIFLSKFCYKKKKREITNFYCKFNIS